MNRIERSTSIELICFDLDGTIIDSEPLHQRAKEQIVADLGYREPLNYADFVGKPNAVFWEPIISDLNLTGETAQSLEHKQYDLILKMAETENHQPSSGLPEFLHIASENGIRLAVCSSSNRWYVEKMLQILHLSHWFGFVVGGDEVPLKKPAPDVYFKALELVGARADNTVAIEDSASGVMSATDAGIPCIGYRNPTSGKQDLSGAVFTAEHMEKICAYLQDRESRI